LFDPTIYDNLKVVLEGALYDHDRGGRVYVSGREDLVDLASMSRTFRIQVQKQAGTCRGQLELSSGLLDFASELRRVRLADEIPGCTLRMIFWLAEEARHEYVVIDEYMQDVWGEVADVVHEHCTVLRTATKKEEFQGEYRITLDFHGKIDENNIQDIEELIEHFIRTVEQLDGKGNSV
jgi:hypothetical protein